MKPPPDPSRRPLPPEDLPPPPPDKTARSYDKGHGRIEIRTLRTTSILTRGQLWKGMKQGFEITRERTVKGVKTVEVVCGATSLSPERADAKTLLELNRGHWPIENGLHYVRDVTLGEDACRVRSGATPQVLAAFRNVVVYLLTKVAGAKSRPEAIERLQIDPEMAKELIGIPPCE